MLKRWILMIICFSLIVLSGYQDGDIFYCENKLAIYTFYTYNNEILTVKQEDYEQTKKKLKDIRGISVSYEGEIETVLSQFKNENLKFSETEAGIEIFYYYNEKLTDFLIIDGEKVNIHIAFNNSRVTIGYPFIFGGF